MQQLVSIIIPIYNEENRVNNLREIHYFLTQFYPDFEIIIVDDGSTDTSLHLIGAMKLSKTSIIRLPQNMGKGYAITTGVKHAHGVYICFMDIDLSVSLDALNELIKKMQSYDVAVCSRRIPGAVIEKHQPWNRENFGKLYTTLSRIVTGVSLSDFTCGCKMFRHDAAKKIFRDVTIRRWAFDSEVIFLASQYKYKITEVGVRWKDDARSKVRFPRDAVESFIFLLLIFRLRVCNFLFRE